MGVEGLLGLGTGDDLAAANFGGTLMCSLEADFLTILTIFLPGVTPVKFSFGIIFFGGVEGFAS